MIKNCTSISFTFLLSVIGLGTLYGNPGERNKSNVSIPQLSQDTVKEGNIIATDTIGQMLKSLQKFKSVKDSVNIRNAKNVPNLSLQQILKGNLSGLYVQEPNGEPGTEQSMILQGASGVMFSKRDFYALQPAIYLNGVPMVQENPFAFDVQKYDYNRIGPATNLLAQIDIDNIQSIVVVKDPYELAKLGPNAANGAIYITTKNARGGVRDISLNSYYGFVAAPEVYTINGVYENDFRRPFYTKYASQEQINSYASYLRDSTNTAYFGPSNWNELYYKNTPTYSANLGITGGNDRANFRFFGSGTKNSGNADETRLNRYNLFFGVNMAPFEWLTVSSNVNTVRMDRVRNRSLRDRFSEARYIPDLSTPLSPNADIYSLYLQENNKNIDDNTTTAINGNVTLNVKVNKLSVTSSLIFDYNEGVRDYFTPSTIMDGVSYISTYFGYNQRLVQNNNISYRFEFQDDHYVDLDAGQTFQSDTYKYNYSRAYNGPNDHMKLNLVEGNASLSSYLNTLAAGGFYVFRYLDKQVNNLFSVYGSAKYNYKNLITLSALLRRDGSSNGQPDNRWVTSPSFNLSFNLKNQFLTDNNFVNQLDLSMGWGRTVRVFLDDRYAAGPQYRSESGWFEEPTIPGYGPVLGINRPYESGFVGYGIKLPYAERFNVNLDGTLYNNRINFGLSFYNRDDKNQLIGVPVPQEMGYSVEYKSGMVVNNKGVEFMVNGVVADNGKGFSWNTGLNVGYNKNSLVSLPNGYNEIIIGDNKLQVGKSIGSYWLYNNEGIYNTDSEVPNGLTFNGIPFKGGDARWRDVDGNNRVDNKDKTLVGDRLPKFIGGWNNNFTVKNFDLNFNFIFATGHKILNQFDATRYGFINREAGNDIFSVKEVSSWQLNEDQKEYPIFNPWSDVNPYRIDQDMFLEDASYLKLRSVTLGYDFKNAKIFNKSTNGFRRVYLYVTAMNLLTFSKFSGIDPELVNYNGYYDGANLTIPKTFVLGIKLDL